MITKLSSGDVAEIAGIPMNTLDRWVAAGLLGPANSGRGHGTHRRYGLVEALAVATGARYRAAGAGADRVAGVVKFLAGLTLERLEADLEAGRTFPVPAAMLGTDTIPGLMIEPPSDLAPGAAALMRRLDLVAILKHVKRKIAELSHRPAKKGRGRRRGLEESTR